MIAGAGHRNLVGRGVFERPMSRWARALMVLAVGALCCLLPASALASKTEMTILQDDDQIIYSNPQHEVKVLKQLHSLGVDVVKVSMVWWLVVPNPDSSKVPKFDASNPAAYPPGAWNRYDLLVRTAHKLGMKVFFAFSPLSPKWGWDKKLPRGQGESLGQAPNVHLFEQFVQAVGRRYSGHYGSPALPRVSMWSVWNEPNLASWLNPTHRKHDGVNEQMQPVVYRSLANSVWKGLSSTGHGSDTFLIGETANVGQETPLQFIEDLYCVGTRFRLLSGRGAATFGCPRTPDRSTFIIQNPGLFKITGWAHHPYGAGAPNHANPVPTFVTLVNIRQMETTLNHVFGAYHRGRHGGMPLYLTEWGYITDPPNPYHHVSLNQQATWINQGEYMTWHDPYVKTIAQFLLYDAPGNSRYKKGTKGYWDSFQTGLRFLNGKPKPSLKAFRLPIWLPIRMPGKHVTVWGQIRPADHHKVQMAKIEFQRSGSHNWTTLRTVKTRSSEGFFLTHVAIGRPGKVRLAWQASKHHTDYSRVATVS